MPLLLFLFLIWIAGFETVTYMLQVMFFFWYKTNLQIRFLEDWINFKKLMFDYCGYQGGITHQDFAGHKGTIHTGDVQVKEFRWGQWIGAFYIFDFLLLCFIWFLACFFPVRRAVDDGRKRYHPLRNACWRRWAEGSAAVDKSIFPGQNVRNFYFYFISLSFFSPVFLRL